CARRRRSWSGCQWRSWVSETSFSNGTAISWRSAHPQNGSSRQYCAPSQTSNAGRKPMPTPADNRPDFIYPGGSPLMHPSLALKQSRMYGFFLRGDAGKLQATVDETLSAVAGASMRFKVLSPFVMITFTQVQRAQSAWPADAAKG